MVHGSKVIDGKAAWGSAAGGFRNARLNHLTNANRSIATDPSSEQREWIIVCRQSIVGRGQPTAWWIDGVRHRLERQESGPLLIGVPTGAVAPFSSLALRDASRAMHGDLSGDIGDDQIERRDMPRS